MWDKANRWVCHVELRSSLIILTEDWWNLAHYSVIVQTTYGLTMICTQVVLFISEHFVILKGFVNWPLDNNRQYFSPVKSKKIDYSVKHNFSPLKASFFHFLKCMKTIIRMWTCWDSNCTNIYYNDVLIHINSYFKSDISVLSELTIL